MSSKLNFYPQCSEPKIIEHLMKLNPCIDIVQLDTSLMTEGIIDKIINMAKNLRGEKDNARGKITAASSKKVSEDTEEMHAFRTIYGFLGMMTATRGRDYIDIPIFNSPQIKTNNDSGFKHEQSLLSFVKNLTTQGLLGILAKGAGVADVLSGGIDEIERIAGFVGWSPRIGPYWSLSENPFNERPSIQTEIKLINDSATAAKNNSKFLDEVVKESLVATGSARKKGKSGSGFGRWWPPKLYNVGLKWGATGQIGPNYVKKYYMCTLDAAVTAEGVVRNGYPDAYSVNLGFSSLLPDTLDAWTGGFEKS